MMGWMAPLRHLSAKLLVNRISSEWEPSMGEVTTIGLDLAKHVFQVHGIDAKGAVVLFVLQPAGALCGWDGGLCDGALLGAGVGCAWARGAADAGAIREGLRQAQQERCGGCGGDLRGGCAADDALCGGEDGRAAGRLATGANAINATLYEKLNFNFIRDIAPVAGIIVVPNVMVVHPSVPAKTVPELIAYAKANPGKINIASGPIGGPAHVSAELFKMMAGTDMLLVSYRGGHPH
jgi:hypothetical protein